MTERGGGVGRGGEGVGARGWRGGGKGVGGGDAYPTPHPPARLDLQQQELQGSPCGPGGADVLVRGGGGKGGRKGQRVP